MGVVEARRRRRLGWMLLGHVPLAEISRLPLFTIGPSATLVRCPGVGRIRRPIPLRGLNPQPRPPCSPARLLRPAWASPVGNEFGSASSGRGHQGRRCPVLRQHPDRASLRRITVHPYKGHPKARTLTPQAQLSAAEKRQSRGRAPDLRKWMDVGLSVRHRTVDEVQPLPAHDRTCGKDDEDEEDLPGREHLEPSRRSRR